MKKRMNWSRFNRKVHYWGALLCALPVLLMIVTGILLQLKKDLAWVQPSTIRGEAKTPMLAFDRILEVAKTVPEGEIQSWDDVTRLDVRPSKGLVKLQATNRWEIQIDNATGEILQVAYRRSDLIESLHDGSFFKAKYWVFLPAAIILLVLWLTGIYLFAKPILTRRKRHRDQVLSSQPSQP